MILKYYVYLLQKKNYFQNKIYFTTVYSKYFKASYLLQLSTAEMLFTSLIPSILY